jgi:ribosomal-protein-alanine acetyltransferase
VRPLYVDANLVVVPTLVSAGTNVKVLEAMAMERAVVSTTSGCAGLGMEHGRSVWIADDPAGFAEGVARLISDGALRKRVAQEARLLAERNFDWRSLGEKQQALWEELVCSRIAVRTARLEDLEQIARIQAACPESARWEPRSYLAHDCLVAEMAGRTVGFVVSRRVSEQESEILNLAVAPELRRQGVATALLREALTTLPGSFYLEVRQSNAAARRLYGKFGFKEAGVRPRYYESPPEDGIVMKLRT